MTDKLDAEWLTALLTAERAEVGEVFSVGQVRTLLNRLRKDGVIERPGARWVFQGAEDPVVLAVLNHIKTRPKRGAMAPVVEDVFRDLVIILEDR